MNENLAIITCGNCQARLKVKPGLLKVLKNIRCSKCGKAIPITPGMATAEAAPAVAATPTPEPAPPPPPAPAPAPEPAPAPAPTPAPTVASSPTPPPEPKPAPTPAPVVAPPPPPAPEPKIVVQTVQDPALLAEVESLRLKLKAAQQEIKEMDERVASLQSLWQGKEIEGRELLARVKKAEDEARKALAIRDAFLARARQEVVAYLVGERDAALSRFSDLEKKLMSISPDA